VAEKLRPVPIGEMVATTDPADILVAYGLGSCVAVCLFDPLARVGGMLHALLPNPTWNDSATHKPTKFVDLGVPLLIDSLLVLGASPTRLITYLGGGARMLTIPVFNDSFNIGRRNVLAAERALQAAGLKIKAQATGGRAGRTIKLYMASGQLTVRMLGQGQQVLDKVLNS